MKKSRQPNRAVDLPFVSINMAMTADGKIATANRCVSSFTSKRDLAHLYELRSAADAVMCGARTVDADDVYLGPGPAKYRRARLSRGLAEYNLRIIVSGSGTINPQAPIFQHPFSPIVILTTRRISKHRLNRLQSVADAVTRCGDTRIDFVKALAWLKAQWGVRSLLCEGGGELNAALFQAGVVHEINLTISPKIFGGQSAPTIADGMESLRLADAARFELKSARRHGNELFLRFHVARSET